MRTCTVWSAPLEFATYIVQFLYLQNPKFQNWLVSVAEQASLCLIWSKTPETGFLMMWLKQKQQTQHADHFKVHQTYLSVHFMSISVQL